MKRIIVTISADGKNASIKTEGYSGSSCQDRTRALEKALGMVKSDEPTEEMYQNQEQQQTENQY